MTPQLGGNHRLGGTRVDKFLYLDKVGQVQIAVTSRQGSTTLPQVMVRVITTLEGVALPLRTRAQAHKLTRPGDAVFQLRAPRC